jgi:hypothetical protein
VQTSQQHPYSVTGIKSFRGREGYGFNATLHRDGRKVAFVIDEANGGCFRYEWLGKDVATRQADEQALADYCATLPPIDISDAKVNCVGVTMPQDADMFLATIVEDAENAQRILPRVRVLLKKHVLFVFDGKMRQSTAAPTPSLIAQFAAKYPTARILNGMHETEAVALYRQFACA